MVVVRGAQCENATTALSLGAPSFALCCARLLSITTSQWDAQCVEIIEDACAMRGGLPPEKKRKKVIKYHSMRRIVSR